MDNEELIQKVNFPEPISVGPGEVLCVSYSIDCSNRDTMMHSTPDLDQRLSDLYDQQYRTTDDLPGTLEMTKIATAIKDFMDVDEIQIITIERWVHLQLVRLRKAGKLGRKSI